MGPNSFHNVSPRDSNFKLFKLAWNPSKYITFYDILLLIFFFFTMESHYLTLPTTSDIITCSVFITINREPLYVNNCDTFSESQFNSYISYPLRILPVGLIDVEARGEDVLEDDALAQVGCHKS